MTTKPKRTRKTRSVSKPAKYTAPPCIKNKMGTPFYVGDVVRLTDDAFQTHDPHPTNFAGRPIRKAKITRLLPDTRDMVVLERKLGGYWTWSVNDLQKLARRKVK